MTPPSRSSVPAHLSLALLTGLTSLAAFSACSSVASPRSRSPRASLEAAPPLPPVQGSVYEAAAEPVLPTVRPEEHPALHNVFELSDDIISGSEPHDEEAFRILQEKGVRTILSVDGKVPDAAMAAKYGIRYVHVPIQYKGITDDELAKISKTFREQEGPFFVHCFHGKHRGPAAAAVGRLVLDGVSRETALAEMRQWSGTSKNYEGLYRSIAQAPIPSESETERLDWDFPSASPLEGIAGAMVQISRAHDHVKAASKNGWMPSAEHPDVTPSNEAAKLSSLFERALSLQAVAEKPDDFRQWLRDAGEEAAALRDRLQGFEAGSGSAESVTAAYETLTSTCRSCHEVYRN